MTAVLSFVAGLLLTMIVGWYSVRPILARLRAKLEPPTISEDSEIQDGWVAMTSHPDSGGNWIGNVERLIFFLAMYLHGWEAIAVWLAFKVASKWEAWNHMGHVPEHIDKVDPLRYAGARRIWAAQSYATFLVGTAMNAFIAGLGYLVARHGVGLLS